MMIEEKKDLNKEQNTQNGNDENLLDFLKQLVILFIIVFGVRSFVFEPFKIPSGSMIPTLQIGDYVGVTKFSYGYSRYSLPFNMSFWPGRILASLPHRGDVAVFRYTQDNSVDYIKRIIGLPGDHIRMIGGKLFINGHELVRKSLGHYEVRDEMERLLSGTRYEEDVPRRDGKFVSHEILKLQDDNLPNNTGDYIVPEGCFFAMGDDRDDSSDSRFHGGRETGKCAAPAGNDYLKESAKDLGFVPFENLVGKAQVVLFSIDWCHPVWAFWYWPSEIRWNRILHGIS